MSPTAACDGLHYAHARAQGGSPGLFRSDTPPRRGKTPAVRLLLRPVFRIFVPGLPGRIEQTYDNMKIRTELLAFAIAGMLVCAPAAAQEEGFDLSAQRSESQEVPPVPGHKRDHGGFAINPTPHRARIDAARRLDISQGVAWKGATEAFADDLAFLTRTARARKGIPTLTIDFGAQRADAAEIEPRSGAYRLRISAKGIDIVGYDDRGAFYALQTLRQIVESPDAADGRIPFAEIVDRPDLPRRGVVEGFYGTPWSHEVRLSLIDFYGRNKLNCYLYGPKDDPYHSCPDWRLPYPEREARNIGELVEACRRNRVDFVWAIHPGQDIRWNEEDYANLVRKFEHMYDLGVRSFAIFFDDISGEGTNPTRQTELLNRLHREFVLAKGDVEPLVVCPTDYSKLWANPTPQSSLAIYGRTLDPSVAVFWTGDVVCSDLTPETLGWVNSRIERPALYWWNFPVTDYVRHIVMLGPTYGLDTSLSEADLCGLVSNPMEHGEASKLALYGVADYAWNIAAYDPIDNWERGLAEAVPAATEAYRTFAIHSCDTETGYRRAESWETETFRLDEYTEERAEALRREFERIERVPAELERAGTDEALLRELRPWLAEFGKLGARGVRTLDLMERYRSGEDEAGFWTAYVANLMSDEERSAYEARKSGTMKLQPFYERSMDDMLYGFYTKLTGEAPAALRAIGSYRNIATTAARRMFDNDPEPFYTSGASQGAGDWIGADLGRLRTVSSVSVLQGRNSTDDVDYFDRAILEYSADGATWHPLTDALENRYEIVWRGTPVEARYVRLKRLESPKSNWAAVRSFEVNPVEAAQLGFAVQADDPQKALYAFDRHPGTSYKNKGVLSFGVPAGVAAYTLLLKPATEAGVAVRQLAADGTLLAQQTVGAFGRIAVAPGTAMIALEGEAEVFEIVPR